jgi:thiazole synthase ThiGH ThiG subunit
MTDKPPKLRIANRDFNSRLIMGTGKFASGEIMAAALEASGAEMVTVALRRADLSGRRAQCGGSLPARAVGTRSDRFDVVKVGNSSRSPLSAARSD